MRYDESLYSKKNKEQFELVGSMNIGNLQNRI